MSYENYRYKGEHQRSFNSELLLLEAGFSTKTGIRIFSTFFRKAFFASVGHPSILRKVKNYEILFRSGGKASESGQ